MREYRVNDAWRPRGKNAANGSILSGGTVVHELSSPELFSDSKKFVQSVTEVALH